MPTVKLNETDRQVSHPDGSGRMKPGTTCEASDLWVRQHTPLVRSGLIEVVKGSKAKKKDEPAGDDTERCQATTKSGSQCKRPAAEGSDYCGTHAE